MPKNAAFYLIIDAYNDARLSWQYSFGAIHIWLG